MKNSLDPKLGKFMNLPFLKTMPKPDACYEALLIYMYIKNNPFSTLLFFFFLLFRAALASYGSSLARGQIGAIAASHSHSNT